MQKSEIRQFRSRNTESIFKLEDCMIEFYLNEYLYEDIIELKNSNNIKYVFNFYFRTTEDYDENDLINRFELSNKRGCGHLYENRPYYYNYELCIFPPDSNNFNIEMKSNNLLKKSNINIYKKFYKDDFLRIRIVIDNFDLFFREDQLKLKIIENRFRVYFKKKDNVEFMGADLQFYY